MRTYQYKLNKIYIDSFLNNIFTRFGKYQKKADTGLLKSLFVEINNFFKRLGGKISSKMLIPKEDDYPDSGQFNTLVNSIDSDLEKLYNAQMLIEDDVRNLMNFNAVQRQRVIDEFMIVQQDVYSTYIKNKKDSMGYEVPGYNPFSVNSSELNDVEIADRVLVLASDKNIVKTIDTRGTLAYFTSPRPEEPIYPNSNVLHLGTHWKIPKMEPHFVDTDNATTAEQYKTMLIDDSNAPASICEFEAVETYLNPAIINMIQSALRNVNNYISSRFTKISATPINRVESAETILKKYIGSRLNIDSFLIYLDSSNSLQGQYAKLSFEKITTKSPIKLVVPFTSNTPFTNEIVIEFSANGDVFLPKINWLKSRVFTSDGATDTSYIPSTPVEESVDGTIKVMIPKHIVPTRMELILEYPNNAWVPFDFYMSHWVYSDSKQYQLPSEAEVSFTLRKSYNIFIDSEPNQENERKRAFRVLTKA